MRKNSGWGIVLLLLLYGSTSWALPARDVRIVTDGDYFEVVRDCIKQARFSLMVMMFEACYYPSRKDAESNALIQELIAAKSRGVEVQVILERREGRERASLRNLKTGSLLSQGGVTVRYDPLEVTTHAKMLLIDGETSVVGSANWTYSALKRNHEVSVVIHSPEVTKGLQDYFRKIWVTCSPVP